MKKLVIGVGTYVNDEGEQYLGEGYRKGIEYMGGEPMILRNETPVESLEAIADQLDGMLFSGGCDVDPSCYGEEREPECQTSIPSRDAMELELFKICLRRRIPILGICRGCQLINVAMGGTLVQDIPKAFGTNHSQGNDGKSPFAHDVRIVPGTMMYEIMGGDIHVNTYHHQCVKRLADGLIPTAYSPEGFIEAYELPAGGQQFLMAVQWHPEKTLYDDMYCTRVFDRFKKAIVG